MRAGVDPYAVLGVSRSAGDAEIHTAYRRAVRRTHPDAGGSSAAFEDVQEAYELLRDPARRAAANASRPTAPVRPAGDRSTASRQSSGQKSTAASTLEDLLAQSRRLEDEARRLAGLATRYSGKEEPTDSVGDILRDAGTQLGDAADEGVRAIRRFIRRQL